MSDQQTFRAILTVALVMVLPIGLYHRIRSQSTRERLDRRQEGLFILATLRPIGAVFWVGFITWLINPERMAWSAVSLPSWIRWAGVVPIAMGCALLLWTMQSLGKNLTDTVVTRQTHTLVVHGPYRWVRHPLYDSVALFTMAIALLAANWFLFAAGLLVLGLLITRTRIEEENLVARFGEAYRTYMQRTGRFLPRIRA